MSIELKQRTTFRGPWALFAASLCITIASPGVSFASDSSTRTDDQAAKSETDEVVDASEPTVLSTEVESSASGSDQSASGADDGARKRPLSVAPLSHAEYPEDRPAWIDATPDLDGEIVVWPVKSSLCNSEKEAKENLDAQVRGAVAAYVEHVLGEERAAEFDIPTSAEVVWESLPKEDRYTGQATRGQDVVYEAAARIRFDERYRRRLNQQWKESAVEGRLQTLGVVGALGFSLLLAGTGLTRRIARKHTPEAAQG